MDNQQATIVHFCTYRGRCTNNSWHKSHEYNSVNELLTAMAGFLAKNPTLLVQYQTRVVYQFQQK